MFNATSFEWFPMTALLGFMVVIVIFFWIRYRNQSKTNASVVNRQYTACNSVDCVRCQKYEVIRSKAYSILCEFAAKQGWLELKRLSSCLESIDKIVFKNNLQQPNVLYMPMLKSLPIWQWEDFHAETKHLEDNFNIIVDEYKAVADHTRNGWSRNNTESGCWEAFFLFNQGVKIEKNCMKCPQTTRIIEKCLSSVMLNCVFGNVFFSRLYPCTMIANHYGPTNVRLRCHLGLTVPVDDCYIDVAGTRLQWHAAQCLVFDDSFLHGVSFPMTHQRAVRSVLIVDFWHPGVTQEERRAIEHVFSSRQC